MNEPAPATIQLTAACIRIRKPPAAVFAMLSRGQLSGHKTARGWVITLDSLRAFEAAHPTEAREAVG